jgi:response regulator of citrate/malate metabolism
MASSKKSEAQRLLDLIHKEIASELEKVEPGFKSVAEWAKMWGYSTTNARRFLRIAEKKKIMECRKYRVSNGNRLRKIYFYRATK